MDFESFVSERIFRLRTKKGVSARDMSLSLGQSESYINKIENHRTLPSMTVFFYICDYFGIHPKEFFDENVHDPEQAHQFMNEIQRLTPEQCEHLLALIKDIR